MNTAGTRLNELEEYDLSQIVTRVAVVAISIDSFIQTIAGQPPEITINGLETSPEIQRVYYQPFMKTSYLWLKTYGYYPWKPRRIPGTKFKYPWVPPFQSGYAESYLDARNDQHFRWYWNQNRSSSVFARKHDPKIRFGFQSASSKPAIDGSFRSDLSAALPDYQTLLVVRQSTEIASFHQARPRHVIEHTPARNIQGDDNLTTLEQFGETIAGAVQESEENLRAQKFAVRTDSLKNALRGASAYNRGLSGNYLTSETIDTRAERVSAGGLERATVLDPDFHYRPVQMPRVTADLTSIVKRFDGIVAAIMDFPIQLIDAPGGNRNANLGAAMEFLADRARQWIQFFTRELLHVYIQCNKHVLLQDTLADESILYDIVEVVLPNPRLTTDVAQLRQLWQDGILTKEAYARYATAKLGVTDDDLMPDARQPPLKRSKKQIPEKQEEETESPEDDA
jgi:hypothetical protein